MTKPLYLTKAQRLALIACIEQGLEVAKKDYPNAQMGAPLAVAYKKLREVPGK